MLSYKRLGAFFFALFFSSFVGYQFGRLMSESEKAPEILINIFSILMSVMLAVMTLSADFRKSAAHMADVIDFEDRLSSLTRLIFLFAVYVAVIIGAFSLVLLDKKGPIMLGSLVSAGATFAMLMSLNLPFSIYNSLKNHDPGANENEQ